MQSKQINGIIALKRCLINCVMKYFRRFQRSLTRFEHKINSGKVIDIDGVMKKYGLNSLDSMTDDDICKLTEIVYKNVLWLASKENLPAKYYNHFHVLFNKLSDISMELRSRSLPNDDKKILNELFTTDLRNAIIVESNRINADLTQEYKPSQIIENLKNALGHNSVIFKYQKSPEFRTYCEERNQKLNKYLRATSRNEVIRAAVIAGLKLSRQSGGNEDLFAQTRWVAEAFAKPPNKRKWYRQYFSGVFRTKPQKLVDVIYKYIEQNGNNQQSIDNIVQKAQVSALFSLRGTKMFEKLTATPITLNDQQKLLWQKRLVEHLTYAFKDEDPFVAPYVQFADNFSKTWFGKPILFLGGFIPPFSILMSPSAEYAFKKPQILNNIFKFSRYITTPFRWVLEKCLVVPIEAPFKAGKSLYEATFEGAAFEGDTWKKRVKEAMALKQWKVSTTFHDIYKYDDVKGRNLTSVANNIQTEIKTEMQHNQRTKNVVQDIPQMAIPSNTMKFAAKFTTGMKNNTLPNNIDRAHNGNNIATRF